MADLVRNVGGELVAVEVLMGPGVDPHQYKAVPSDTRKLNAAHAVFYNGLHLEGRMAELLERLADRKLCIAVASVLEREHAERLRRPPEFEGSYDPHVWFDALLWALCADYVADELAAADPAHAADYRRNAARYRRELESLHQECLERIATIPEERRVLVTAHDAFGYFGQAYGLEVHGIQGISTVDEASLAAVNQLVELLVQRKIKAVFVETSVPRKYVQALVDGCAARGHRVSVGGSLYSDALGEAGKPEGTYQGMMRYNVETIVKALK